MTFIIWASICPRRGEIDFYPTGLEHYENKHSQHKIAERLEIGWRKYCQDNTNNYININEFFNASVKLNGASKIQTTQIQSFGRGGGFSQPGFRNIERFIIPEGQTELEIYAYQSNGEWRLSYNSTGTKKTKVIPEWAKLYDNFSDEISLPSNISNESLGNDGSEKMFVWVCLNNLTVNVGCDILSLQTNILSEIHNKNYWIIPIKICQILENQSVSKQTINYSLGSVNYFVKNNPGNIRIQSSEDNSKQRFLCRIVMSIDEYKQLLSELTVNYEFIVNISDLIEKINCIDDLEYPNEFKCPITHDIMTDPVKISSSSAINMYYDRSSIEQWFLTNNKDPYTGENLTDKTLVPVPEFKKGIEDFLKKIYKLEQNIKLKYYLNKIIANSKI